MSTASDILLSLAADAAKEAFRWAIDKLKSKAKEQGIVVDDDALEELVNAQFGVLVTSVRAMKTSIDHDVARLEEAELRFRASSNVTVVASMDEPWPGESEPGEPGEPEPDAK